MTSKTEAAVLITAAAAYAVLQIGCQAVQGVETQSALLRLLSPTMPLLVVFGCLFLLTRHAAASALLAGGAFFALDHWMMLEKARATGFSLKRGQEEIFAAGRLTAEGARRLTTDYALQTAALLLLALAASWSVRRLAERRLALA